jgi:hypothetical protein
MSDDCGVIRSRLSLADDHSGVNLRSAGITRFVLASKIVKHYCIPRLAADILARWTRTLGPREGLRFSRPSSLAAIGPVPRMYASRAAFGSAARRLAECVERVPADARIAVLVGSDDTRTPPFVSEAIGLPVGKGYTGGGRTRAVLKVVVRLTGDRGFESFSRQCGT